MKYRLLPIILLISLILAQPFAVSAQELDVQADASLTVYYQKDGVSFPDLEVRIYRVAQAFPDGTFALIEPFSGYPVNIHDIQSQSRWRDITTTLCSWIAKDSVPPDRTEKTDETGSICFSGLETGLYMVEEVIAENDLGVYTFNAFMVYVPTPQANGEYDYQVEAKPKCTAFVPNTHYTVTKLWQDGGNTAGRPSEVAVEIYKNGELFQTQTLNAKNNWSYTWQVDGNDRSSWTVAERSVPDGYKLTIRRTDNVFSLINTRQGTQPKPPTTGDSFPLVSAVLILCLSGMGLVITAAASRRRR